MLRAGQFPLSCAGQLDAPAQDNWMLWAGNYFPNIIHTASFVMGSHVGTRTREHARGQASHGVVADHVHGGLVTSLSRQNPGLP